MVTYAQIIPAQLEKSFGNATGIEELSEAQLENRAATFSCRTTGVFPVSGSCSAYYLCQRSPSGQLLVFKRTCYPNNYNPFMKICSSLFNCTQPYACGPHGFLCLNATSYVLCNTDNIPERSGLCTPGSTCNNKCNSTCTDHVLAC